MALVSSRLVSRPGDVGQSRTATTGRHRSGRIGTSGERGSASFRCASRHPCTRWKGKDQWVASTRASLDGGIGGVDLNRRIMMCPFGKYCGPTSSEIRHGSRLAHRALMNAPDLDTITEKLPDNTKIDKVLRSQGLDPGKDSTKIVMSLSVSAQSSRCAISAPDVRPNSFTGLRARLERPPCARRKALARCRIRHRRPCWGWCA